MTSQETERATKYSDLKLIDELLCELRAAINPYTSWADLEQHSSVTYAAFARLRAAYASGEMPVITLSLANHFRDRDSDATP